MCNFNNANLTNTNFLNCIPQQIGSGGVVGTPMNLPLNYRLISGYLLGPAANLVACDLSGLNLSEVNLQGAFLLSANFRDADLTGANLRMISYWYAADFSNANLTNADFSWSAYFQNANFTNAIWSNTICPSGGEPQSCSCQTYPTGGCP